MEISRIIVKPLHTEKTYALRNQEVKKYAFIVDKKADKKAIAIAFDSIYGFMPEKIATITRKPTKTRTGTAKPGYTKLTKIAYVTLPKGKDIAVSQEDSETKNEETK